ncbi:hypothetical protein CIHG_02746 [Coccidioides immitis H538.4]|nr:hypothetical protein CIRG_03074 [Coccidioides immitis RMSCC 2394]KMU73924.1 hypothetical protein CISG_03902 [Coccidioides immitis RMSCC 3703]KMU84962.1 hypothetical protein CIHG_02746 [Coccidioides immitis H538.4]
MVKGCKINITRVQNCSFGERVARRSEARRSALKDQTRDERAIVHDKTSSLSYNRTIETKMTFAWKTAGLTYNRYLAIAARTVRRSLKPELRLKAERGASEMKFAKWENGRQGEFQNLAKSEQAPADATSAQK